MPAAEATPGAARVEPPKADEAEARHHARLITLSYRYSQGGIGTQNRMLRFIQERFHPALMRGPGLARTRELTHRAVAAVFLSEGAHPATAVPWDHPDPAAFRKSDALVVNELADLFARFEDPASTAAYSPDPVALCESVLVMDADYLRRPGGRAGSDDRLLVRVGAYRRDPWDSVYVRHAVLRQTTRTDEFDALFAALGIEETLRRLDTHGARVLRFVLERFIAHHPLEDDRRLLALARLAEEL